MWLTLEEAGYCERQFRSIADVSGNCDRLFHSLGKILDGHVFPLLSRKWTEKNGSVGKWRNMI